MTGVADQGDMGPDDGAAIHYSAVAAGTPVYSSDGVQVGTVREMLDNYREHIFDGVIFRDTNGTMRFADAPEVARTAERGVTLTLDAAEAGGARTAGGPLEHRPRAFRGRRRAEPAIRPEASLA